MIKYILLPYKIKSNLIIIFSIIIYEYIDNKLE